MTYIPILIKPETPGRAILWSFVICVTPVFGLYCYEEPHEFSGLLQHHSDFMCIVLDGPLVL